MNKYLIIDTETSGLFDFSKPADAEGQPRMASFAGIPCDEALNPSEEYHRLVKPDGWTLEPGAAQVNGLTLERLTAEGVVVRQVLDYYTKAIDDGLLIVSFNAQFDTKVMRGELRRAGLDHRFHKTKSVCLMRPLTEVCRIPRASGRGFKFPKLAEAMAHFAIPANDAHTSLGDCRAALDLFRHAKSKGVDFEAPKADFLPR